MSNIKHILFAFAALVILVGHPENLVGQGFGTPNWLRTVIALNPSNGSTVNIGTLSLDAEVQIKNNEAQLSINSRTFIGLQKFNDVNQLWESVQIVPENGNGIQGDQFSVYMDSVVAPGQTNTVTVNAKSAAAQGVGSYRVHTRSAASLIIQGEQTAIDWSAFHYAYFTAN
jgi:hypothetical protein